MTFTPFHPLNLSLFELLIPVFAKPLYKSIETFCSLDKFYKLWMLTIGLLKHFDSFLNRFQAKIENLWCGQDIGGGVIRFDQQIIDDRLHLQYDERFRIKYL